MDALLVVEQHLLDAREVAQAAEGGRDVALVQAQLQGGRAQLPLDTLQVAFACAVGGLVAAHLQAQILRGLDLHALQGALQPLLAHQQGQVVVRVKRRGIRRVVELTHLLHQLLMLLWGEVGQSAEFGRDGAMRMLHHDMLGLDFEALAFQRARRRTDFLLGGGEFEVRLRDFELRLVALHARPRGRVAPYRPRRGRRSG
jgi:hypothetical protein